MGKKKPEEMAKQRKIFVDGAVGRVRGGLEPVARTGPERARAQRSRAGRGMAADRPEEAVGL